MHLRSRPSILKFGLLIIGFSLAVWSIASQRVSGLPNLTTACPAVRTTQYFTFVYGSVTVNDVGAPAGTVVEARSPRGDTVGCIVTATAGQYPLMYVYGEETVNRASTPGMRQGEGVVFYVNGNVAASASRFTWNNTWVSTRIDLNATIDATATMTTTPTTATTSVAPTTTATDTAPASSPTSTTTPSTIATSTPIATTPVPTATATNTTATAIPSAIASMTATAVWSPTPTSTAIVTTPVPTATATNTAITVTPSATASVTATATTVTTTPSVTREPTTTQTPTATATETATPQPSSTVIEPNRGGSLNAQIDDLGIGIFFLPGSHSQSFTVSIQSVAAPPAHGSLRLLGQVFTITARDSVGALVTEFNRPFTLNVSFTGTDWSTLADIPWVLQYWDAAKSEWIEIPTQLIAEGVFEASLDHLTMFAVLEREIMSIYLPAIQR